MNLFLNNPPRWIAKALQIVSGGTPPAITPELYQVADSIQGGHGLATWRVARELSLLSPAVPVPRMICGSQDSCYLVRMSFYNNDGVARLFTTWMQDSYASGIVVYENVLNVAAGAALPAISNGGWVFVPAGIQLWVSIASTTVAGQGIAAWTIGEFPAGTKPL